MSEQDEQEPRTEVEATREKAADVLKGLYGALDQVGAMVGQVQGAIVTALRMFGEELEQDEGEEHKCEPPSSARTPVWRIWRCPVDGTQWRLYPADHRSGGDATVWDNPTPHWERIDD